MFWHVRACEHANNLDFHFPVRGGGSSLTNTQADAKSYEIRAELETMSGIETQIDELLEVLEQVPVM